jgi:E3 ubiquitin-protein ligase HUWE1
MHKEVKVDFVGDKVQDAGGLLREWLLLLFKELTHPNLGLFVLAETEDVCYRINPDLQLDDHLKNCLRLCGKAIGKAVFERYISKL